MAFVVLEGFSGTGKTSLARGLEERGWVRLTESAHAAPQSVPLADRADTYADYSLFGLTVSYSSLIAQRRGSRNLVSEGYLLSDLAYAKIRHELGKSAAYPALMSFARELLKDEMLRPDLYVVLEARPETIGTRQLVKEERDRNETGYFRDRYYGALEEVHRDLGEGEAARLLTDTDMSATMGRLLELLKGRGIQEP